MYQTGIVAHKIIATSPLAELIYSSITQRLLVAVKNDEEIPRFANILRSSIGWNRKGHEFSASINSHELQRDCSFAALALSGNLVYNVTKAEGAEKNSLSTLVEMAMQMFEMIRNATEEIAKDLLQINRSKLIFTCPQDNLFVKWLLLHRVPIARFVALSDFRPSLNCTDAVWHLWDTWKFLKWDHEDRKEFKKIWLSYKNGEDALKQVAQELGNRVGQSFDLNNRNRLSVSNEHLPVLIFLLKKNFGPPTGHLYS